MDNNGWISVEEDMPKEADIEYVCSARYMRSNEIFKIVIALIFDGESFGEENQIIEWNKYVTHWQPLPEFPEAYD